MLSSLQIVFVSADVVVALWDQVIRFEPSSSSNGRNFSKSVFLPFDGHIQSGLLFNLAELGDSERDYSEGEGEEQDGEGEVPLRCFAPVANERHSFLPPPLDLEFEQFESVLLVGEQPQTVEHHWEHFAEHLAKGTIVSELGLEYVFVGGFRMLWLVWGRIIWS